MAKPPCELMRAARKKAKKTQAQVAEELGFTQAQIAKWEKGEAFPVTGDLRRVAEYFGLRPEQLIPPRESAA